MSEYRSQRRSDVFNLIAGCLAAVILGASTAGAAIILGPDKSDNPATRPLSVEAGAAVSRAFGADDEDCVRITRRITLADGSVRIARRVVCEE